MNGDRSALESALTGLLEGLGVRALGRDQKVIPDPGGHGYRIRLAMPALYVDVEIDQTDLVERNGPIRVHDKLDAGARILFAGVVDHIAKHDRSPVDRVKDIEAAATALLDAMRVNLDDVRMPYGLSSAVLNAAYKLRELVAQKPGAAAWGRNGYGQDPPEVQTAP